MAGHNACENEAGKKSATMTMPETGVMQRGSVQPGYGGNMPQSLGKKRLCRDAAAAAVSGGDDPSAWCYVNLHYRRATTFKAQVEAVDAGIRCFVHTTVRHTKMKHGVKTTEQPTVSGLVFLQGTVKALQQFLDENFSGVRLARDRATGRTAVISDTQMQPFMAVAGQDPTMVRFLDKPIGHFAAGNVRLRVLSGPLAGQEGYLVRIARDRKLVMEIGGMTVAIGNVHKEQFAPTEE